MDCLDEMRFPRGIFKSIRKFSNYLSCIFLWGLLLILNGRTQVNILIICSRVSEQAKRLQSGNMGPFRFAEAFECCLIVFCLSCCLLRVSSYCCSFWLFIIACSSLSGRRKQYGWMFLYFLSYRNCIAF